MAEQEVSIKLKADASDALKSVKDLEKAMSNVDSVKKKGDSNDGFISNEDVRNFKKNVQQAENVYKQFLTQYDRMQQEFDRRKKQLEGRMGNAKDDTTVKNIQKQIDDLEKQRQHTESQRTIANNMNQRVNSSADDVRNMRSGTNFGRLAQNFGSSMMTPLIGALSFGKLFGFARQGMGMINNEEAYGAQLGNRWQQYNGDYTQLRKDAMNTGMSNGYTAQETMKTSDILTSMAGNFNNANAMWNNVQQIQTVARAMGIDPNQMAQAVGQVSQRFAGGQMGTTDQKQFANLIAGAVNESGMQGRQSEMTNAITSLATQAAQTKTSLTKADLAQITGLETAVSKDLPSMKGAAGAQLLSGMDAGIKSSNNNVDLLLGWGTKYQGLSGRAALDRAKSKGITDPTNVSSIFTNMGKATGNNKDLEQLMMEQDFGWSGDQAAAVLNNKDLMKTLQNGGLTKKQMDNLSKMGASDISKYKGAYDKSKAGQRARTNTQWQKTLKWAGEGLDNVWRPIASGFTSLPPWMQWGGMAAGAGAATMYGGKALQGGINWLGRKFSRPVTTIEEGGTSLLSKVGKFFGGVSDGAGNLLKGLFKGGSGGGSGLLKGAGKLLGPLGDLSMLDGITRLPDWLLGHKKGDLDNGDENGLVGSFKHTFMSNPFKPQTFKSNEEGALQKGWDWIVKELSPKKAEAAELSPSELKKESQQRKQLEQKKQDTAKLNKENLKTEADNTTKKSQIADKDSKNNQDLKKNIDNLNNPTSSSGGGGLFGGVAGIFASLFGMNGGGGSGGGSGGIGGFFSNIWGGIKNFFGMGGSGGSGGGSGSAAPTSLSGKGNENQIYSFLKSKGMSAGAIAGVMGNLQQESSFDPNAINSSSGATGIGQWLGSRLTGLNQYASKNGMSSNSMNAQLGYLWQEMSSGQYGSVSAMNGMNPSQAAQYFETNFEKAGSGANMGNRVNYANSIYSQYGSSGGSTSTPTGTTHNVNVTVSGSVNGMTPANQALIAGGIKTGVSAASPWQSMYQFSQGVGGNR